MQIVQAAKGRAVLEVSPCTSAGLSLFMSQRHNCSPAITHACVMTGGEGGAVLGVDRAQVQS